MRLLSGVLAGQPFRSVLTGDASLRERPMERVAEPLRLMGATVATTRGHAPITIEGRGLVGIRYRTPTPTAQVKGAVLFAGASASGPTTVEEDAPTRDHTERALAALGGSVITDGGSITIEPFQHEGFHGACPGDASSAAFLVAAAALTGSSLTVRDVGLNPSRTAFLEVMRRMGVATDQVIRGVEVGEPRGELRVRPCRSLEPVVLEPWELPLVIDEVPVLALLAAHARGDSRFPGARELRLKESDRLEGIARGIGALGGHAAVEGDDLVVAGGGLEGGETDASDDHRMAMAFTIGCLAARRPCEIEGAEAVDVSFPGFFSLLQDLGAGVEVVA